MAFTNYYGSGTISVSANGTAVTGVGTLWSTPIVPGDTLEAGGRAVRILSVTDDTHLTLAYGWPSTDLAASAYIIVYNSPDRNSGTYVAERARELIERQRILANGATFYSCLQVLLNTPPGSPVADDLYVVGTTPTGAWTGYAGYLAIWLGSAWGFTAPEQGWYAYDKSTDNLYARKAAAWANATGVTVSQVGAANGVASLDSGGKVPASQLPAIAITNTFVVSSQSAMLALTVEPGDVAVRTDVNKTFILTASPATTLANWQEMLAPTAAVSSVAGRTGAVTLVKADVGLGNVDNTSDANKPVSAAQQAALDAKASLGKLEGLVTDATTARTLALTDLGKAVEMTSGSANTLTVPPNSSVAFPLNAVIPVLQMGAGQTTIAAGAGVTIRSAGGKLKLAAQYAQASLYKRGTDEWVLAGNLTT